MKSGVIWARTLGSGFLVPGLTMPGGGGDLDLYIEISSRAALQQRLRCKYRLEEQLDLHVDLVVKEPGQEKPIFALAKKQGVLL